MGRSLFIVIYLVFTVTISSGRRLPRGFTQKLYCSACRSVAYEIHAAHSAVPESETIDSGSFRLSESGKQLERKQVPLRRSELHAVSTLDNVCTNISVRYVLFKDEMENGPFVSKDVRSSSGVTGVNFTDDCSPVRALHTICAHIVDDHEDALKERLKEGDIEIDDWTNGVCGPGGIVSACHANAEPQSVGNIIELAKKQEELHNFYQATLEAERRMEAADANTTSDGMSTSNMSSESQDNENPGRANHPSSIAGDILSDVTDNSKPKADRNLDPKSETSVQDEL